MKNSYQSQKVIEEVVKEKPNSRWLFLTLSIRNAIDGDTLKQSLTHLNNLLNDSVKCVKLCFNVSPSIAFVVL